jgi:hypothetical protein
MKTPQRWLEDTTAPAQLKRELSQLEAARVPYDTEAGWAALRSAIDAGGAGATPAPPQLRRPRARYPSR